MIRIETLDALSDLLDLDLACYEQVPPIQHAGLRISYSFHEVVGRIKGGDWDAALVGLAVILRDPHLPFGRLIRRGVARALRQRPELLSNTEVDTFLDKTVELLNMAYSPRELKSYCQLVRRLGRAASASVVAQASPPSERSRYLLRLLQAFADEA